MTTHLTERNEGEQKFSLEEHLGVKGYVSAPISVDINRITQAKQGFSLVTTKNLRNFQNKENQINSLQSIEPNIDVYETLSNIVPVKDRIIVNDFGKIDLFFHPDNIAEYSSLNNQKITLEFEGNHSVPYITVKDLYIDTTGSIIISTVDNTPRRYKYEKTFKRIANHELKGDYFLFNPKNIFQPNKAIKSEGTVMIGNESYTTMEWVLESNSLICAQSKLGNISIAPTGIENIDPFIYDQFSKFQMTQSRNVGNHTLIEFTTGKIQKLFGQKHLYGLFTNSGVLIETYKGSFDGKYMIGMLGDNTGLIVPYIVINNKDIIEDHRKSIASLFEPEDYLIYKSLINDIKTIFDKPSWGFNPENEKKLFTGCNELRLIFKIVNNKHGLSPNKFNNEIMQIFKKIANEINQEKSIRKNIQDDIGLLEDDHPLRAMIDKKFIQTEI